MLLHLICGAWSPCDAQSENRKPHDYIISHENDTLFVDLVLPPTSLMPFGDSVWIQDHILVSLNGQSREIFPGGITGFCFNGIYHQSIVLPGSEAPKTTNRFCRRIRQGVVSVFMCYETKDSRVHPAVYFCEESPRGKTLTLCKAEEKVAIHPAFTSQLEKPQVTAEDLTIHIDKYVRRLDPKTSH